MALQQLHQNSKENPTLTLKGALESFSRSLTSSEKQQYQNCSTTPAVTNVVEFVAQIDASNKNNRRCVAPRLCTFLESIQQFSGVVDTFINSNPDISALVWGSAKMAILIAANVTSYFEKITSIIMTIGKMCPTYQEFGQLYPGCVGLQRALSDFYAGIVHLCIKIVEISRRSTIRQTISSVLVPFELEFKPFIEKLDQDTKDIYLQILLASEKAEHESRKLLQCEQRENATFRPLALSTFKNTIKHQSEANTWRVHQQARKTAKLRSNIRSNLSTINYIANWRQAIQPRVSQTAEWLLTEPEFVEWKESKQAAILWCSGTMGMGKTVLIANVIAHFHANREMSDIIAYHFCRSDNETSLSAKSILGSLARQIIDSQISNSGYDDLVDLHDITKNLQATEIGATEMTDFILSHLRAGQKYYIIIDGLDECDSSEIREVAQCVRRLCSESQQNLKILYSSWPEIGDTIFATGPDFKVSVNKSSVNSDMQHYITATLDRCLAEHELKLGNPMLILDITTSLLNGSNGMYALSEVRFLWARLLIQDLCSLTTDDEILEALKHLPLSLSEVFDRKMDRVCEKPGAKLAISLLRFCGVTKRPMSTTEFKEALSLHPDQKDLDPTKIPTDMNRVIRNCCGLAFVDEEDDTVHYVHHSVKQHLFTGLHHGPDPPRFDLRMTNLHIGSLCMVYLDFNVFRSQLAKAKSKQGSLVNPLLLDTMPIYRSSKTANQMAQRLLVRYRQQLQQSGTQDMVKMAQEVLGQKDPSHVSVHSHGFQFLGYAQTYWINHVADLDANRDLRSWDRFRQLIEHDHSPALKPWELCYFSQYEQQKGPRELLWAIVEGHFSMLLFHARDLPETMTETVKRMVIQAAVAHGDCRLVKIVLEIEGLRLSLAILNEGLLWSAAEGRIQLLTTILKAGAEIDSDVNSQTPLQAAVAGGHLEAVNLLLAGAADVNASPGQSGQTALQAAAATGHRATFETLLAADADFNSPPSDISGRTALQAAAEAGHSDLMQALILAKADVNAPSAPSGGRTALQAALERGHVEIIEILIATGANINAPAAGDGVTALQAAAGEDHCDVLQLLLANGANPNSPAPKSGRTVLQAAAQSGHLEIVKSLLAANADVNAPPASHGGRTALQGAAENGHYAIAQILLIERADINAPPSSHGGRTALQAAAGGGYLDIVEELLKGQADVNANCAVDNGRTALQAASGGGRVEVIKALLREGARIDEPASLENGRTALQAAAEKGHTEIVRDFLKLLGYDTTRLGQSSGRLRKNNHTIALPVIDAPASSRNGRTMLQAAAQNGHIEVVRMLVAASALINAPPAPYGGRTALQAAAEGGHLEIVRMLLANGHDANGLPAPYSGRTALQAAVEGGHMDVVKILIEAKADVTARASTHDGVTALDAAKKRGFREIEILLIGKAFDRGSVH